MPTMYVVAGPAGSGKSSAFPGDQFGCAYFNSDNYAAMLNGGSYVGIPVAIRKQVVPVCQKFIRDHISSGVDFATETTLRSPIVFDQIKHARRAGFHVWFIYVCVDDVQTAIRRVAQRAYLGGHSGSEGTVREIYLKSLVNFPLALHELARTIDFLDIYDNSIHRVPPRLLVSFEGRRVTYVGGNLSPWLHRTLDKTPFAIENLLHSFKQREPLPVPIGN